MSINIVLVVNRSGTGRRTVAKKIKQIIPGKTRLPRLLCSSCSRRPPLCLTYRADEGGAGQQHRGFSQTEPSFVLTSLAVQTAHSHTSCITPHQHRCAHTHTHVKASHALFLFVREVSEPLSTTCFTSSCLHFFRAAWPPAAGRLRFTAVAPALFNSRLLLLLLIHVFCFCFPQTHQEVKTETSEPEEEPPELGKFS